MTSVPASPAPTAEDEVVDLCRDLIRIDTTNTATATSAGERAAAEYVAGKLAEVGIEPQLLESAPGRANVVARIPGADPAAAALLVHGHLDVVPADAGRVVGAPVLRRGRGTATCGAAARST